MNYDEIKHIAYYLNGELSVMRKHDGAIPWATIAKNLIKSREENDVECFFPESIPEDEKYRDAWVLSPNKRKVVVDEMKALEIARKRAKATLIRKKNRMIAEGRRESLRTRKPFKGLSPTDELDFSNSMRLIEECGHYRQIEIAMETFDV